MRAHARTRAWPLSELAASTTGAKASLMVLDAATVQYEALKTLLSVLF